ncbi:4688_t:CDS:2, partial [Dentiscutata heterogama]
EIEENLEALNSKLGAPISNKNTSLYNALKKGIEKIDISEHNWQNPLSSTVISDESQLVKNLKQRQRRTFLEPREDMKCEIPELIYSKYDEFVNNFNKTETDILNDLTHDKTWKENVIELEKVAKRIFNTLGEIWNNPAFETKKCEGKLVEYLYLESSRIICNDTKKNDDETKLWRELLDRISYINSACRSTSNQFGVVRIQVASEKISLNVLINDVSGIPRYFHVDHAKIPLTSSISWRQAISHPPRNVHPSPAVFSLCREESGQKRPRQNSKTRRLTKQKSAHF